MFRAIHPLILGRNLALAQLVGDIQDSRYLAMLVKLVSLHYHLLQNIIKDKGNYKISQLGE